MVITDNHEACVYIRESSLPGENSRSLCLIYLLNNTYTLKELRDTLIRNASHLLWHCLNADIVLATLDSYAILSCFASNKTFFNSQREDFYCFL